MDARISICCCGVTVSSAADPYCLGALRMSVDARQQHYRRSDRRGSAAVEFAIVGFPFVLFLVFLLELGYDFYAQMALDYALQSAARQIQIGVAQGAGTAAVFQSKYLCPVLTGLLPCTSVTVNVVPVTT